MIWELKVEEIGRGFKTMLNKTRRFVLAALPVAAIAFAMATGAAASDLSKVRVSVPFGFDLNGTQFEAGAYTIESGYGSALMTIARSEGRAHAFLGRPLGNPSAAQAPKLVFYVVDKTYYLAEVWLPGSGMGKGVPVKKEIEFQARRGTMQRIEVALNR
jgi:hypothetical protein